MKKFREIKETLPCETVSCEVERPSVRDFELRGPLTDDIFVDPFPGDSGVGDIDNNQEGIFFDPYPGDVSPE